MTHDEYLTCADFPAWTPTFGRDEDAGIDHGTEAEFNADCDRLAEQVQALVPGSCASWSIEDDGVTYLVYWDSTPGVAEDYSNRETDDPEVEAVFLFATLESAIESLKQMQENTAADKAKFLVFMAD